MCRSRGQHFRGLHSTLRFPSAPVLAPPTPARQTQRPVNHRHGRGPRRHGSLYCDKRSDGMKKKKKKEKERKKKEREKKFFFFFFLLFFFFFALFLDLLIFRPAIFNLKTLRINTQGS